MASSQDNSKLKWTSFVPKPQWDLLRPILTPSRRRIEEERTPGYDSGRCYPAKPGDVLGGGRWQILVKLGYGCSSTTWLPCRLSASDPKAEVVATLKIINSDRPAYQELEIEEHIKKAGSSHRMCGVLRTNREYFQIDGPKGKHLCLVYEAMREPMNVFQHRFKNLVLPLPLLKMYLLGLLKALDCLHRDCSVVHGDLKLENILMSFHNHELLSEFVNRVISKPAKYILDVNGRQVFYSNRDYIDIKVYAGKIYPFITDFGSAMRLRGQSGRGMMPIQANSFRAPEVILGFLWDTSADIWNLGAMLWDIVQGEKLFKQAQDSAKVYNAKAHLAEMIGLLGMPPPDFIEKSHSTLVFEWPKRIRLWDGTWSKNACELYGGPFFDKDGNFLYEDLIPDRKLEDTLSLLDEKERRELLSFVGRMLVWVPEDRATARELLQDPFFDGYRPEEDA